MELQDFDLVWNNGIYDVLLKIHKRRVFVMIHAKQKYIPGDIPGWEFSESEGIWYKSLSIPITHGYHNAKQIWEHIKDTIWEFDANYIRESEMLEEFKHELNVLASKNGFQKKE